MVNFVERLRSNSTYVSSSMGGDLTSESWVTMRYSEERMSGLESLQIQQIIQNDSQIIETTVHL